MQTKIVISIAIGLGVTTGIILITLMSEPMTNDDATDILAGVSEEDELLLCGNGIVNSNIYIKEYLVPTYCSEPVGIVVDSSGKVWFAETLAGKIGIFDPKTEEFEEIEIPNWRTKGAFGSMVWGMKFDREGNLWFTDEVGNSIRNYDPVTGKFERYIIPTRGAYPVQIDFDAEGNVWFAEIFGKKIGRIDLSLAKDGTSEGITEFAPDAAGLETMGELIVVSKGNIWFTMLSYPSIGKLMKYDPESNIFTTYKLPEATTSPVGILEDDGNLWINDHGTNLFFKFDTDTKKIINVDHLRMFSQSYQNVLICC